MFLLIKTNARILDLRPVSDFPPCSSGRIPIQGDDKEHLDKHVGFDRWKCTRSSVKQILRIYLIEYQ